jgi:hypothetical protein
MIELNQSAQCLFCPQRRKIAMLMKLILAGSAAIIMSLILFLPRVNRAQVRPNPQRSSYNPSPSAVVGGQVSDPLIDLSAAPDDAIAKKSAEVRQQAQKRFQEVQSQLRILLAGNPPTLAEAENLLEKRKKEVLLTKLLVLGEELFAGSTRAEAHRKLVLDSMEKELATLSQQGELLIRMRNPK